MPNLSFNPIEFTDGVIYNSLLRVMTLKSDNLSEGYELIHLIKLFRFEQSELIYLLGIEIMKYNGIVDSYDPLEWSFVIPADETAYNLIWDVYKTEDISLYDHDAGFTQDVTIHTLEEPEPEDVTNLNGIVTIIDS